MRDRTSSLMSDPSNINANQSFSILRMFTELLLTTSEDKEFQQLTHLFEKEYLQLIEYKKDEVSSIKCNEHFIDLHGWGMQVCHAFERKIRARWI